MQYVYTDVYMYMYIYIDVYMYMYIIYTNNHIYIHYYNHTLAGLVTFGKQNRSNFHSMPTMSTSSANEKHTLRRERERERKEKDMQKTFKY